MFQVHMGLQLGRLLMLLSVKSGINLQKGMHLKIHTEMYEKMEQKAMLLERP